VTRLQTPAYRFNPPGSEPESPSPAQAQAQSSPLTGERGRGSPCDFGDALPLSSTQMEMKQNIAALNNRTTDVDGTLFRIDYEPLGSKQRMRRSVCKMKTF